MGGGRISDTVSDILVLDKAQSDKVTQALEKVQASQQEKFQASMQGGQNMSREERRAAMEKISAEVGVEAKAALKGVISDGELDLVAPFLGTFRGRGLEMRALRQLDLKAEERTKLRTETVAFAKASADLRSQMGQGGGGQPSDFQEKMQALNKDFMDKVGKVISADQVKAWQTKIEDLRKEMEQNRPQR